MIDHAERIKGIVLEELVKVVIGELAGFAIAQSFAPAPGAPGTIGPAWLVTITLASPLVGAPDIAPLAVLAGSMPPDEAFRHAVRSLIEQARQQKSRLLNPAVQAPVITALQ